MLGISTASFFWMSLSMLSRLALSVSLRIARVRSAKTGSGVAEMLYLPAGLYMLRNQDSSLWPPLVWGHMPSKPMPEDAWYWRWVTASITLTWGLNRPPSRIIPAIASYWL